MERCFSTIAIKSLDEDQRIIRGVASTPEVDRQGDIVEPLGLRFKNPVSLLWQHRHDAPIGTTVFDRPTKAGLTFTATIPKVSEAGTLRDRVDEAWHSVKHGVVRAVSIGFRSIEHEPLPSGGLRFKKAELFELSLVSVPACSTATIEEVKAIDAAVRRGDPATNRSALWSSIGRAGSEAFDEVMRSAEFASFNAMDRTQLAGTMCNQEMVRALVSHVERLERRMDEQGSAYKGVWKDRRGYGPGSFVTHGGSMWHTDRWTERKPGEGDWTLAVKRGADARGA